MGRDQGDARNVQRVVRSRGHSRQRRLYRVAAVAVDVAEFRRSFQCLGEGAPGADSRRWTRPRRLHVRGRPPANHAGVRLPHRYRSGRVVVRHLACTRACRSGSATTFEPLAPVFGESTTRILMVTTIALLLSATPVSKLPNSTAMGTALVYIFVAGIGARAEVARPRAGARIPARRLHLDIHSWRVLPHRSAHLPRRRAQRRHCIRGQCRSCCLCTDRRGTPQTESRARFDFDGAARLRDGQLPGTVDRLSRQARSRPVNSHLTCSRLAA